LIYAREPPLHPELPATTTGRSHSTPHLLDGLYSQAEYAAWYEGWPDNLRDNPTGEALEIIVDLDLDALAAIVPPLGYGRD
jgi:hypothetical protein